MLGLHAAGPYIRREIGQRLRIRRAPELHFVWDETLEHAQRIERLLSEVRQASSPDADGDDA
jgi:ribosome-binding factor A